MPAVFVHGVPETHRIWNGVRSHLSRKDVITPDLPGFSAPVPAGWTATKEEYAAWLITELEKESQPVDLVGHDWGALLTIRVVSLRPDLVRTWAIGGGAVDEGYTWHPVAQMWQTPGMGEQFMAGLTPEAMQTVLTDAGVGKEDAAQLASHVDDDLMKDCILKLYRSAVNVGKEWGPDTDRVSTPGMLVWGKDDPYMQLSFAEKLAKRTGAKMTVLDGVGHWWPLERPKEVAETLESFWASA